MTVADVNEPMWGVVSIESVRLTLFLGSLFGYDVIATDIGNAYLHAYTKEKVYTRAGPEFGELEGRNMVIVKAQYGLHSSSSRWHEVLSATLRELGYRPSLADTDLWIKSVQGRHEYIATDVDDLIIVAKDPMAVIAEFETRKYPLKGTGVPEYYLGGNVQFGNFVPGLGTTIALSAVTYIERIVEKIEGLFDTTLRQYSSPMESEYHPEIDDSPALNDDNISRYRMLIGCANWVVTLGRFDVFYATQTLARYNSMPREGHMKAAKRLFGYLKFHKKGRIVIDTTIPTMEKFPPATKFNWTELYPEAKEEFPPDTPPIYGLEIKTHLYFDADHASDMETRRSVTGILFFVNNTPIKWYSKRQNTVESSTYGSELVAARMAVEMAIEMRYKLRMLGANVVGPTVMFCDNMSVVLNCSLPTSALRKKHNAIAYHKVRQAIAAGIVEIIHVPSAENLADPLTKALGANKLAPLIRPILFRAVPGHGEYQREGRDDPVTPSGSGPVGRKALGTPGGIPTGMEALEIPWTEVPSAEVYPVWGSRRD